MLKCYSVILALAIVVYGWNIQFESAHKQMGWRPPARIRYLHRCRPRRTAASIPTSTTLITDGFQMAFGKTHDLSDYPKGGFTFSIESQKKHPPKKPRVRLREPKHSDNKRRSISQRNRPRALRTPGRNAIEAAVVTFVNRLIQSRCRTPSHRDTSHAKSAIRRSKRHSSRNAPRRM